jgi:3-hydroxyacyl-CoA dehydrogenase
VVVAAAIVRCIEGACAGPTFLDGDRVEKKEFAVLVSSPESNALRHMFFAERAGVKIDGLRTKPQPITSVGIVGAGLMGGGIAMCCAEAGIPVTICDVSEEGLKRGLALVQVRARRGLSRGLTRYGCGCEGNGIGHN